MYPVEVAPVGVVYCLWDDTIFGLGDTYTRMRENKQKGQTTNRPAGVRKKTTPHERGERGGHFVYAPLRSLLLESSVFITHMYVRT